MNVKSVAVFGILLVATLTEIAVLGCGPSSGGTGSPDSQNYAYNMNTRDQVLSSNWSKATIDESANNVRDALSWLLSQQNDSFLANNSLGNGALLVVSASGDTASVTKLITHGANVNTTNNENNTPLILAAQFGNVGTVSELIGRKAYVNAANNDGNTALIASAQNGYYSVVQLLLDNGASLGMKNNKGYTALIAAAVTNQYDVVSLLANKGADINAKDNNGFTAIVLAMKVGVADLPTIRVLKNLGANMANCTSPLCNGII